MHSTYAQTQKTAQKKEASTAAAVLDASSQNEGLQRKADMANGVVQRLFKNTMPDSFDNENQAAINAATTYNRTGTGPGPFPSFDPRFKTFINTGAQFKWVLRNDDAGLVIIDPSLKHSIAASGNDVITAGTGQLYAPNSIWINNDTGHYKTSLKSLDKAKAIWEDLGYNVDIRERVDFTKIFNKPWWKF